ncbi:uncharacterized protein LOC142982357 [Anticarsia gemmatalis]|uniref:uncharacterized protein LOC142982357 n=1 Tax=Anticarsia gemmatalis TaxID=129554 RepID=UPI003F76BE26
MTSKTLIFFVASLTLCASSQLSIDSQVLHDVFGYAPQAAASQSVESHVQASAVTPPPDNGTLVDFEYWDNDDFSPATTDYDKFDWTLTKRVAASSGENFLLSPLGLKLALAILTEAATGVTQSELSSALGFDLDRNLVRRKFASIIESLQKESSQYILNLGSRIYIEDSAQPRQRFAAIAQEFYKTELKTVNFYNPPEAAKQINSWVSNITQGRIPNLVNEDDVANVAVLVLSTLFFKGSWRHQFAPNATKAGQFYVSPKTLKNVPFMNVNDKFYYTESSKFDGKILRMPYLGNKFAMYIIVPNSLSGLSRVLENTNLLRAELNNLREHYVDVTLPRFKFDYTSQLDGILRELGVRQAFEETASFPGIARGQLLHQRLRVSKVLQRSGIEVNELGSVAYSATEISLVNKFGEDVDSQVEVVANRPFLFFIQDEATRQLLFTGRVTDPTLIDGAYKLTPSIICLSFQIWDSHGAHSNSRLNFFDIDLLKATAEDKKGNVMVSPASIKSTLAMILEGADGATAAEIKSALRVSPAKDDFRHELNTFLRALEANSSNVFVSNANALFVSNKLKLKKDYETVVQNVYLSEIGQLDFKNTKSSAETINTWVDKKTKGLIPSIIEEAHLNPTTEMVITNALYFKAPWKHGFSVRYTHTDCFYREPGVCKNVAMMDLQAELKYAFVNNLRAHALELPYQGDRYSMILLVPQDRDAGVALIRDLPFIGLPQITDLMDATDVVLTMPKFDVEYNENLVEALKHLRITSLFSQSSNLSGIFDYGDSAHLNSIYHSVHMKVDEVGTVAAAATGSLVVPLINNQVQLRVDRPFLFFIRDNKLGITLFEGKIDDPTEIKDAIKGQTLINTVPVPIQGFPSLSSSTQNQPQTNKPTSQNPITSSSFQNQAISTNSNFNGGSTQQTVTGNKEVHSPYESTQSHNLQSSNPSSVSTVSETESQTKKNGGITGWFRKLGSYF